MEGFLNASVYVARSLVLKEHTVWMPKGCNFIAPHGAFAFLTEPFFKIYLPPKEAGLYHRKLECILQYRS